MPEISATPEEITFPAGGGTKQIAVSASSDYAYTEPEGFKIMKQGKVLLVTALDNSTGETAKEGIVTLTLAEDVTKTTIITLRQPAASVAPAKAVSRTQSKADDVTQHINETNGKQ